MDVSHPSLVESTPDLDMDSSDVDGNPKPNMVEGLVGLTHGVGSAVGVAVGWPSKVTNLEAPQPLVNGDVHHPESYTWSKHSTDHGNFQRVSENIRVDPD
jgi:hypothetical protein